MAGGVRWVSDQAKREERRRRKMSRASAVGRGDILSCDDAVSATEHVERRWRAEHERRGLARLFGGTADGV